MGAPSERVTAKRIWSRGVGCFDAGATARAPRCREHFAAAIAALASALAIALLPAAAHAVGFGPGDAFQLRGKLYTQYTVATEPTQLYTQPGLTPGNMKQWRNYMNPEFETNFRTLAGLKSVDELSGRLTLWGFYDAIYDYGPRRFNNVVLRYEANELTYMSKGYSTKAALAGNAFRRDPRNFYGRRIRVNEAYVDVAKGPAFLRVGRQAISWGEADTIGLLDANNPFDTLLQPGFFIDIDEARIPLWTIRATYELFESWGPLSSGYVDMYLVPGSIDTTIAPLNIASASPYSSPPPAGPPSQQQFDKLPTEKMGNSRWGVKLQGVIARDYNLALWFYKTFPVAPVPTLLGLDVRGRVTSQINHGLTNVIGAATSFYSDALVAIVRAEVELFNNEPAFLAYQNIGSAIKSGFTQRGTYDGVNFLRGEIGMDRNVFIPMLNPTTSFTIVNSVVFAANLDESDTKDYRANGIIKPSAIERQLRGGAPAGVYSGPSCDNRNISPGPGESRCDYVNLDAFQAFTQNTIMSDFMHGHLNVRLTIIGDFRGALAFQPTLTYRYSDNLIFGMSYANIHTFGSVNNGYVPGVGLNRDRDQVYLRATYQLN